MGDMETAGSCAEAVNVRGGKLGSDGAQRLAQLLEKESLTTLDADRNLLGDAGAELLAAALRHNRGLTHLKLRCNEVGIAGLTA